MATSNVFVVDSTARRTQVKVTPGKYMRDVLEDACRARKLNPEGYTLKTQTNKPVDLSQPFRLSALSAGAKLQLTQASKSPGVVSVALQLPDSEGGGRLSDKFPSTTSLWLMLRKYEDGVAGSGTRKLNLTQRGVPSGGSGSGAGRLLYEQPCLNIMGRGLEGLEDLQKTLAQLGYNGGSVMMRLSFRGSGQPLEEAMGEISRFFAGVDGGSSTASQSAEGAHAEAVNGSLPDADADNAAVPAEGDAGQEPNEDATAAPGPTAPIIENDILASSSETQPQPQSEKENTSPQPTPPPPTPPTDTNGISIYRPPSSSTPLAALQPDDPAVFEPSIEHAKAHQASLENRGKNQRLKSDREIAEMEDLRQQRLEAVQSVVVRVQYPDQHVIETRMGAGQTAGELYGVVRETLRGPGEGFELRYPGPKGLYETLPNTPSKRLVRDFGFRGRVLVRITLPSDAGPNARQNLSLRSDLLSQAQELKVELATQQAEGKEAHKQAMAKPEKAEGGGGKGGGDIEAKMKRWIGFGKK